MIGSVASTEGGGANGSGVKVARLDSEGKGTAVTSAGSNFSVVSTGISGVTETDVEGDGVVKTMGCDNSGVSEGSKVSAIGEIDIEADLDGCAVALIVTEFQGVVLAVTDFETSGDSEASSVCMTNIDSDGEGIVDSCRMLSDISGDSDIVTISVEGSNDISSPGVKLGSAVSAGCEICGKLDGSTVTVNAVKAEGEGVSVKISSVNSYSGDAETIAEYRGSSNSSEVGLGSTDSSGRKTSGDSMIVGDSESSTGEGINEMLGGGVSEMFDFDGDCDKIGVSRRNSVGSTVIVISGDSGDSARVTILISYDVADISGVGNSGDVDTSIGEADMVGVLVGSIIEGSDT